MSARGRRQFDGSTGKMMAYGIGGGSVIGVLLSVFAFINNAPWASKQDVENDRKEIQRLELVISSHINGPGHTMAVAEMASVKATLGSVQETLREIKDDVKDIKERPRK